MWESKFQPGEILENRGSGFKVEKGPSVQRKLGGANWGVIQSGGWGGRNGVKGQIGEGELLGGKGVCQRNREKGRFSKNRRRDDIRQVF